MNRLISNALQFILVWSVIMSMIMVVWSIIDDELLAPVSPPGRPALASSPPPTIETKPAHRLVAPVLLPAPPSRETWTPDEYSTDHAPGRYDPQRLEVAQKIEVPGDFPLSEEYWRNALPEEIGLEPITAFDPMPVWPEPPDNPWGGEWADQGGGG